MGRLTWLALVAACGSPSATPDAGLGRDAAVLVPGANVVTVRLIEPTKYIKYRNGNSGWGDAEGVSPTEYRLHVDDAYEVIIVCDYGFFADSQLYGRTFGDGDLAIYGCPPFDETLPPEPPTVAVGGQMQQPGWISTGFDSDQSSLAPWSFTLELLPDTYDLIAMDTANRLTIRRDLAISGATTLPSIDLDLEGASLDSTPFVLFGLLPGDTVATTTALYTARQYVRLDGSATELVSVPGSLLVAGDAQYFSLAAAGETTRRSVFTAVGAVTAFELPPPMPKLTWSVPDNKTLRGDWTTIPECDELELFLFNFTMQQVSLTRRFLAATQRTYIALDTPPDFKDAWRVSLRDEYVRELSAVRTIGAVVYRSSRDEQVTNVTGN